VISLPFLLIVFEYVLCEVVLFWLLYRCSVGVPAFKLTSVIVAGLSGLVELFFFFIARTLVVLCALRLTLSFVRAL
jgi:hypothetical protein